MNEKIRTYKRIAIFFFIDRVFNNEKISSQPEYKDRSFRNEEGEKRGKTERRNEVYLPRTTSSKCHPILAGPK